MSNVDLYFSTKLVALISHDFSYKAFSNYIRQPYLNQISINSSELISITTNNVNQLLGYTPNEHLYRIMEFKSSEPLPVNANFFNNKY